MSSPETVTAVPRDFLCEHLTSKSRVMVVTARPEHADSVHGVLTTPDPETAERASALLRDALGGATPRLAAEIDRVCAAMPAPVAISFRQAAERAGAREWPVPAHAHHLAARENGAPAAAGTADVGAARLVALPGDVVRVIRLVEYHVHDVEQARAEALRAGWEPGPDDEPDDCLDAVMHLTDPAPRVAGADRLTLTSVGSLLDETFGDEVAAWSPRPVQATFRTGWRLAERPEALGQPDFEALFPVTGAGDDDWELPPRTAAALYRSLCLVSDLAYDDVLEHGDRPVGASDEDIWSLFDALPRLTWHQDREWRRDVARAADDLADDLAKGRWPTPRCAAEEMMLHLGIAYGEEFEDHDDDLGLPEHDDDYDWDACATFFFQDHDVLMPGDAEGIEHPEYPASLAVGVGGLRPPAWFSAFGNVKPRDPLRPYRR